MPCPGGMFAGRGSALERTGVGSLGVPDEGNQIAIRNGPVDGVVDVGEGGDGAGDERDDLVDRVDVGTCRGVIRHLRRHDLVQHIGVMPTDGIFEETAGNGDVLILTHGRARRGRCCFLGLSLLPCGLRHTYGQDNSG